MRSIARALAGIGLGIAVSFAAIGCGGGGSSSPVAQPTSTTTQNPTAIIANGAGVTAQLGIPYTPPTNSTESKSHWVTIGNKGGLAPYADDTWTVAPNKDYGLAVDLVAITRHQTRGGYDPGIKGTIGYILCNKDGITIDVVSTNVLNFSAPGQYVVYAIFDAFGTKCWTKASINVVTTNQLALMPHFVGVIRAWVPDPSDKYGYNHYAADLSTMPIGGVTTPVAYPGERLVSKIETRSANRGGTDEPTGPAFDEIETTVCDINGTEVSIDHFTQDAYDYGGAWAIRGYGLYTVEMRGLKNGQLKAVITTTLWIGEKG